MPKSKLTDMEKNLCNVVSRFQSEAIESGADAIVVIVSMTQNNQSKTMTHRRGNTLLCDAILRHSYNTEGIIYIDDDDDDD